MRASGRRNREQAPRDRRPLARQDRLPPVKRSALDIRAQAAPMVMLGRIAFPGA
jgi:hypothetical protein